MPSGKTIRRVGTLESRRALSSATGNVGIPTQIPPRVEQERVYPRPLTQRETKDASNVDRARRYTNGYSDRTPILTGTEVIDTTGKSTISAIPSKYGRSKALSRSNAFRQNMNPLAESDRNRIMAFRDAASPSNGNKSGTEVLSRNSLSNRNRESSRSVREKPQAMSVDKFDKTRQDRPSRRQLSQLPKLNTDLTEAEIRRQVREAWFRGGRNLQTPES